MATRAPARSRNMLTYAPSMSVGRYLDSGMVGGRGGSVADGAGTATPIQGSFVPAADTPNLVSAVPGLPAGGVGGAAGGTGGLGGNLLTSLASAALSPNTWKAASQAYDWLAGGGDAALAGGLPVVAWGGAEMGAVPAAANPFGLDLIWSPYGLDALQGGLMGGVVPAAEGVTAGTATGVGGGVAAESAAPAIWGGAEAAGGLAGAGAAEAGSMGPALAAGSPLAGAAAFALPLAIAAAGWLSQPDTSATGGVLNFGATPDGRAALLGGSAKGYALPNVQGTLDSLNAWMAQHGLSLDPAWRYNQVVGSGTEHDPLSSTIWDRLGFQAGDAFRTSDPALQPVLDQFYTGWGDFSQALGGGPSNAVTNPGVGYRLSPQDASGVFGDGFLPLFGGTAGGWSDRWQDLATREAARTAGISSEAGGGDLHPRADALGLPIGFLEMFDRGLDPRTLPTSIQPGAMNDAYLANLRGEAVFDPYAFAVGGAPAAAPVANALAALDPTWGAGN